MKSNYGCLPLYYTYNDLIGTSVSMNLQQTHDKDRGRSIVWDAVNSSLIGPTNSSPGISGDDLVWLLMGWG